MPAFDLRGLRASEYMFNENTISYGTPESLGDAMKALLDLKHAEGRLYAESSLKEYLSEVTGGTLALGVKYIPRTTQPLLFGRMEKTRSITVKENDVTKTKQVKSLVTIGNGSGKYVGVVGYAPDMIDGNLKFTAFFIHRIKFAEPGRSYQTKGENIVFDTPTTVGEVLADDSPHKEYIEDATLDTEEEAIAWGDACLGVTSPNNDAGTKPAGTGTGA